MTEGGESREDIADEAAWTRIADEDEAWAAPTELPPPLADEAPALLNTHEMGWVPFERLVLAMARGLDGGYDARRYGRPGQAQHGLDAVAFFAVRSPSVYEAKHWQAFGASDLENAVERYAGGRRPFGADRIVIAVASEVRDTAAIEKLAELRKKHPDIQIELWDRQEISDRLRNQPRLVTTHFGAATAAAFCAIGPPPAAPAPGTSISADAVLRGPIAHLGLVDELRRAEDAVKERPDEAADLLAGIAARLESSGFVPHAAPIRDLQARALRAAGRRADEAWVRIDLGWQQLEAGDTLSAEQVRQIAEWGDDAPNNVVRCSNALAAATGLRRDYGITLEHLSETVDALTEDDPHRVDAALVLAEEAVASRRSEIVQARADLLRELAASTPHDNNGNLTAARLLACVADCCGGWDEFAATARDTYPPQVTALVLARHARYLALVPQPEASIARWRDAIERACIEGLNDDAADWLYALRATRVQNGLISADINDLHRHAQALRAAGHGGLLPEPYEARERGLASLRNQEWPTALESLRRYLWRSAIGADWAGEIDAHELLGDLFAQTGRACEAIRHYVMAGERKKLEKLADALRDEPVRLPVDFVTPRPWERAAAFSFVAACADLVPDEEAREWCRAAFGEIVDPHPVRPGAPDPVTEAFKAFGQLAPVCSVPEAGRFLDISRGLIPRQPGTYHFTDEAQVHALLGIARAHPALRADALGQLLQALLVDQRMAELILVNGHDLLREDPARTVAAVAKAAAEGNHYAAFALLAANQETASVVSFARERLQAAVTPRVHKPGVLQLGTGMSQVAGLAAVLPEEDRIRFARAMLEFANDQEEPAQNRYEELIALRGIARHLPDTVRDELFEHVLPYAEDQREAGQNELFPGANDPLQRFRFSLGNFPLAPAGLMAAGALAHTNGQYTAVERAAVAQLRGADEVTLNSIATALAAMPPEQMTIPVELLAGHPSHWLRALAAVVWAQRSDEPENVGLQLAEDSSRHVRGSLATSLQQDARCAKVRTILSEDPRRSVRQLLIRSRPH